MMDQQASVTGQVFALLRRRFLTLWLAAFWSLALLVLFIIYMNFVTHARALTQTSMSPLEMWQAKTAGSKFMTILVFVLAIYLPRDLATIGVSIAISSDDAGKQPGIASFISRFLPISGLVLASSAVLGHLVMFASFMILPGFFLAIWSAFVMPAIGSAREHPWNSARRSFGLTLKRFPALMGLHFLFGLALIVSLVPLIAAIIVLQDNPIWWLGRVLGWSLFCIVTSLVVMVRATFLVVLYRDTVRTSQIAELTELAQPS